MHKEIIATDRAPAAIGPYSQGVKIGDFVFTAGQIALDPRTGKFVEGDITVQTEQVMQNLSAVLNAAGVRLENVVKTTVFLQDMADFASFNEVYGRFFAQNPPARSTVQAAKLPLDAKVEIEAIAYIQ